MHGWFSANPHSLGLTSPRMHAVCWPYWAGRFKPNSTAKVPNPPSRWLFASPSKPKTQSAMDYDVFNLNYKPGNPTTLEKQWQILRDKISGYYGAVASNKIVLYSADMANTPNAANRRSKLLSYMYQIWTDMATPGGSYYPLRSDDVATLDELSILKYIEVTFNSGGANFAVTNTDHKTAKKIVKAPGDFQTYLVTEAQRKGITEINGLLGTQTKRKYTTTDDDNEFNPEIFDMTEAQALTMLETDDMNDSDSEDTFTDTPKVLCSSLPPQILATQFDQIVIDDISASDTALQVQPGSNLYYLIGGLHNQCMNLSEAVNNNGDPWQMALIYGDEFASWIANIFYFNPLDFDSKDDTRPRAVTSFSAWGNHTSSVDGFRVDVENFCGTHWNLVWKSDNVLSQLVLGASTFKDRQSLMNQIESYGVIKDARTLVMGLDIRSDAMSNSANNNSETFKLIDVLHLISYVDPKNQSAASIPPVLFAQLADIQMSLDFPIVTDWQTQEDTKSQAVQAMWFVPGPNYSTTLRIDFVESTNVLTGFLTKALVDCTVEKVKISAVRRSKFMFDPPYSAQVPLLMNSGVLCLKTKIQLPNDDVTSAWEAYINIDQTSITIILRWNQEGNPLEKLLGWIDTKLNGLKGEFSNFSDILGNWYNNGSSKDFSLLLREVCLVIDWSGESPSFTFASLTLEMDLNWGVDTSQNPNGLAPFKIEFYYSSNGGQTTFGMEASLWPCPTDITAIRLNPTSPLYPPLTPACSSPVYSLSLEHLGIDSKQLGSTPIPSNLPKVVSGMDLVISTDTIRFMAALSISDQRIGVAPTLALDEVKFAAAITWASQVRSIDLVLHASATLDPQNIELESAMVAADAEYLTINGSSYWQLSGVVYNLTAAHIYSLFPSIDRAGILNVMEDININEFNIDYTYNTAGQGFSFIADGFITIGSVSLGIDFQYNTGLPNGLKWQFVANMDWAADPDVGYEPLAADLLSVLQDMVPPGVTMPDFMKDVRLAVDVDVKIQLECFRTSAETMVLSLDASIAGVEFTYIHMSPTIDAQGNVTGDPIRVFKCEVNALPNIQGIPLLSNFEQPFDQMGFVWTSQDLTRATVDLINSEVFNNSSHSELVYRDPRNTTSDTSIINTDQKNDKVILAGSHLIVAVEENNVTTAIVDYTFNTAAPNANTFGDSLLDDAPTNTNDNVGGASAVLQKSKGPITVGGLGLKYQNPNLLITFDATIDIGFLKATLKGFGFQFNLASLFDLRVENVSLLIDGVGLELKVPPVSLAGEVVKKTDAYFGGVDLAVEPYNFLGGGYYGETKYKDPNNSNATKTFDTTFVFAELAGPFVELEFASLTGLTAGFGHNSHMTLPTVDNVTSFPFLQNVSGSDPLAVLNSFIIPTGNSPPWFGHDENALGEIWMAAGFTAKAFHSLNVSTVLTVDFSSSDIILGLFADATATVPPEAPEAELFAKAEMGLLAVVDWAKGIFKVEGQLTPASFILDKDCKLKGGFSLCYFFEGSGHNGDWVFSIGGYHPSYVPPAWYPKPQRVGVSWVLDSNITISGEAYFAVTPKCCMGGGKLDLTFQSGQLQAWFNAYADFLVNYSPFSFMADIGVSIGISYTVSVGCLTKHFGVNFGCSLHMHGPPVAGYVRVAWSIISFDIYFGNANETTAPLNWNQFQDLIRQDGKTISNQLPAPLLLKASATNGLMSSPDTDPEKQISTADDTASAISPVMWNVNHAIFSFDIVSMFPTTTVVLNNQTLGIYDGFYGTAKDTFGVSKTIDDVAMRPMQIKQKISSTLSVTITNDQDKSTVGFKAVQLVKQVPTALWDICKHSPSHKHTNHSPANMYDPPDTESADPISKNFSSTTAFSSANSTKPLLMGISLNVPPPTEKGPFIALDLVNATSYDCYKPVTHPVYLPSPSSKLPDAEDSFTALPPTYNDLASQETAFQDAVSAWQKSASDATGTALGGLVKALGIPSGSKQAVKMAEFVQAFAPPQQTMEMIQTAYVVPPLLSKG